MPLDVLLGKPPKMQRDVRRRVVESAALDLTGVDLTQVAFDVLRHPTVASKRFLITIGDRTVGGLSSRDPMVGPWQVPVADCAVTLADFSGFAGEAMAMGERTPLAVLDAPASGRMAVGEAITNLLAAPIELDRVKLSCNWMAACSDDPAAPGDDAALYDTVRAVAMELCPALGISVPVGKDSLSMRTRWRDEESGAAKQVTAPVSLVVSAFATLADVRLASTPQLVPGDTTLILVDLGAGRMRMAGSMLAQVLGQIGSEVPDLDDPARLRALVDAIGRLRAAGLVLAYHDRSDGGLWATVCEMAFAGHLGVALNVDLLVTESDGIGDSRAEYGDSKNWATQVSARREELTLRALFNEELGAVIQVPTARRDEAMQILRGAGLSRHSHVVGKTQARAVVEVWRDAKARLRRTAQAAPSGVGRGQLAHRPPARRAAVGRRRARGCGTGRRSGAARPPRRRTVRRGPGARRHAAQGRGAARAGRQQPRRAQLCDGPRRLRHLRRPHDRPAGGPGAARHVLRLRRLRRLQLRRHARRGRGLGALDPVQSAARRPVRELLRAARRVRPRRLQRLPDAGRARRNDPGRGGLAALHARTAASSSRPASAWSRCCPRRRSSSATWPAAGCRSRSPMARASPTSLSAAMPSRCTRRCASSTTTAGATEAYPANPNGSPGGLTGVTTADGRYTALMPHPERVFRNVQMSWTSGARSEPSPWLRCSRARAGASASAVATF